MPNTTPIGQWSASDDAVDRLRLALERHLAATRWLAQRLALPNAHPAEQPSRLRRAWRWMRATG